MDPQILRRVVEEGTQAQAERGARLTATNRALERVGLGNHLHEQAGSLRWSMVAG